MSSTVDLSLIAPVISGYTIALGPQQVSLSGAPVTATISLTPISTTSASAIHSDSRYTAPWTFQVLKWWEVSLATGLASCFLFLLPFNRRRHPLAASLALVSLLSFAIGCGGGSGSSASPPPGGGGGTSAPASTSITLSTSNAKAAQYQSFLITATVNSSKPVTGDVVFYNFGKPIVTSLIANSQAQIGGPGYINNPGLYQITATYNGDVNNQPSTSSSLTQVITGTMPGTLLGKTGGDIHSLQVNFGVQ
jgi:hypothetical protein